MSTRSASSDRIATRAHVHAWAERTKAPAGVRMLDTAVKVDLDDLTAHVSALEAATEMMRP